MANRHQRRGSGRRWYLGQEGETAYLNEELVAEVQDPDDKGGDLGERYEGVHIVTWQWSRSLD